MGRGQKTPGKTRNHNAAIHQRHLQCVISGTWSTSHGRTGSFPSRVVNLLIGRGMLKKLDADTVKLTDAGRDVLAKIKEAANG